MVIPDSQLVPSVSVIDPMIFIDISLVLRFLEMIIDDKMHVCIYFVVSQQQ